MHKGAIFWYVDVQLYGVLGMRYFLSHSIRYHDFLFYVKLNFDYYLPHLYDTY
jgi:hypothetical protein